MLQVTNFQFLEVVYVWLLIRFREATCVPRESCRYTKRGRRLKERLYGGKVELVVGRGCTRRREIGVATADMLLIDEVRVPSGKLADIEGNG
jgi:hypothetical protein